MRIALLLLISDFVVQAVDFNAFFVAVVLHVIDLFLK
jgi:hypothetical protein